MSGGGMLGLGKSKSREQSLSESDSTSDSYGFSSGMSGGTSGSTSRSTQEIAFKDLYAQLFGGAMDAANAGIAGGPELGSAARSLFTGGLDMFDSLGGNDAGSSYMADRLSSDNPVLDQQISMLGEDAGRMFREQLMPGITQSGVESGTLGNDREGIAMGMGMDSVTREFMRGATQLRANDINQRDMIASTIATNTLQGASTGLGALPSLLDTLINSSTPELGIYANLSKIMGGPTVLGSSISQSAAQEFSKSFGQQGSTSRSRSRGSSSGRSDAWDFKMAGSGGFGGSSTGE